ncbi:ester cyclase [Muriicola sp. E247]|uniref:ester cyclase n=1 Tax=Muriicola sp. E247 TaxID=3242730 RepID=UPI003523FDBC
MKRATPFTILLAIALIGCQTVEKKGPESTSNVEKVVITYVDSCWNTGDFSALDSIVGKGFVRNLNGLEVANGPMELEAYIQNYIRAFPNLRITVNKFIEKDDKVILEWSFSGTNTGEFAEFIATGKKAIVNGVTLITFDSEGKMIQENTYYNELYLLQQLGFTLNPPNLK